MENNNLASEVNSFIRRYLWLDFEVSSYNGIELVVVGRVDELDDPIIEITFYDVFFVSMPMTWKTETEDDVFSVVGGDDARKINMKFKVESGYTLFKFVPEYYDSDFGCLIASKKLDFKIAKNQTKGLRAE